MPSDHASPRCPKCSGEMVLRQRRSDGRRFYGCSSYPKCTGTRPYSQPKDTRRLTAQNCKSGVIACSHCPLHCTNRCFMVQAFEGRLEQLG